MTSTDSNSPLDPKAMAKYLGFHEMTVYRFLREGKLPAKKVRGRWQSSLKELDDWLMNQSVDTSE